jgi:hypothetical protein
MPSYAPYASAPPAPTPYAYPPAQAYGAPTQAAGLPAAAPYAIPMGGYQGAAGPLPGLAGGYPMALPAGYQPAAAQMAAPFAQPMHPYMMPGAYASPYAAPHAPLAPPPAPPPTVAEPLALAGGYSPPASFDPMAPLLVPGQVVPGQVVPGQVVPGQALPATGVPSPRVVGFAAGFAEPSAGAAAIPMGSAVPATGAVPVGTALPATAVSGVTETAARPVVATVSKGTPASAAILAAERDKNSSQMLLMACMGAGALLLVCALVYVVANAINEPEQVAAVAPEVVKPNPEGAPQPIPREVESPPPTPVRPAPVEPIPPVVMPAPETVTPQPMPEPMTPTPAPVPEPTPTPTPTPEPAPTPPTPAPMPAQAPAPEPPPPMVTKEEAIALGKALTMAKIALGEQNFEEADKQLAIAEPLAKLPEHQAKCARLKEVAEYAKQFRKAVEESVAALEAGATFKVGTSTMVVVVETFPDKIIIRSLGQNKTYPFPDLPAGLAVAIADMKLDPSAPENRVIKGAYLAVDKRGDSIALDKAKAFWEEAQLAGVDTSHLLPFLSDKYDELEKDISAVPAPKEPALKEPAPTTGETPEAN